MPTPTSRGDQPRAPRPGRDPATSHAPVQSPDAGEPADRVRVLVVADRAPEADVLRRALGRDPFVARALLRAVITPDPAERPGCMDRAQQLLRSALSREDGLPA